MRYGLGLGLSVWNSNYLYPSMSLDFLSGSLDPKVTFTRASTATYFGSDGLLKVAAADAPRFDYDPVTLQPKGLLIEGPRTNILLNSATLATQSVTVTAQAYTLTFYGTGSVALSGTYAGSLAGTGAANRVSLSFTATAGSLTATVTGSVTNAQIEAGAFATSYIPTTGSASTRAADNAVMTGANFSNWFNPSEGTVVSEFQAGLVGGTDNYGVFGISSGAFTNGIHLFAGNGTVPVLAVNDATVVQSYITAGVQLVRGSVNKVASAYKINDFARAANGDTAAVDTLGTVPIGLNQMSVGRLPTVVNQLYGHIRSLQYYRTRLTNSELQRLST